MELLISELWKSEGEAGLGGKIKSSVLDMGGLRCLLENLRRASTILLEI